MSHCRQLQKGEGLSQSLRELEGAFKEVDRKSGPKEHNLQVDSHVSVLMFASVSVHIAPAVIIDWSMLNLNQISIVLWYVNFCLFCLSWDLFIHFYHCPRIDQKINFCI